MADARYAPRHQSNMRSGLISSCLSGVLFSEGRGLAEQLPMQLPLPRISHTRLGRSPPAGLRRRTLARSSPVAGQACSRLGVQCRLYHLLNDNLAGRALNLSGNFAGSGCVVGDPLQISHAGPDGPRAPAAPADPAGPGAPVNPRGPRWPFSARFAWALMSTVLDRPILDLRARDDEPRSRP